MAQEGKLKQVKSIAETIKSMIETYYKFIINRMIVFYLTLFV